MPLPRPRPLTMSMPPCPHGPGPHGTGKLRCCGGRSLMMRAACGWYSRHAIAAFVVPHQSPMLHAAFGCVRQPGRVAAAMALQRPAMTCSASPFISSVAETPATLRASDWSWPVSGRLELRQRRDERVCVCVCVCGRGASKGQNAGQVMSLNPPPCGRL